MRDVQSLRPVRRCERRLKWLLLALRHRQRQRAQRAKCLFEVAGILGAVLEGPGAEHEADEPVFADGDGLAGWKARPTDVWRKARPRQVPTQPVQQVTVADGLQGLQGRVVALREDPAHLVQPAGPEHVVHASVDSFVQCGTRPCQDKVASIIVDPHRCVNALLSADGLAGEKKHLQSPHDALGVGGLDTRVLETNDRDIIRQEVSAYIEGMKARGARLVFASDHSISPNTRYESYLYALEVYREHMHY